MRLIYLLLCAWSISGQTLRVSSVVGAPGGKATLEISLDSPASKAPVALQWETVFPAQSLVVEGNGLVTGSAARDSGKSIACAGRWRKAPETYSYLCILAGGRKPIANGSIAVLHCKLPPRTQTERIKVRVEKAQAVTADLEKRTLQDAEGTVRIH